MSGGSSQASGVRKRAIGGSPPLVAICGHRRLQNNLLSEFLAERTKVGCRVFSDWHDAVGAVGKDGRPALLVIDAKSDDLDIAITYFHKNNFVLSDNLHVLLFNVSRTDPIKRYIYSGIKGILYEDDSLEMINKCISCVSRGDLWYSREALVRCVMEDFNKVPIDSTLEKLTSREQDILRLISDGYDNTQIAEKLFISFHTVKTHISNIYKKLKVSNRIQAALWFREKADSSS